MTLSAAAQNSLALRNGVKARWGLHVTARNRATNAAEPVGLWQGDDHQNITVATGDTRLFAGAQGGLVFEPIRYVAGVLVQTQTVTLNGASPDVLQLTRQYDVQLAKAEIFRMILDPQSDVILGVERMFVGFVSEAPAPVPEIGGTFSVSLTLKSSMAELTKTPNLLKSNQAQEKLSGDTFYRDSTVANAIDDPWK